MYSNYTHLVFFNPLNNNNNNNNNYYYYYYYFTHYGKVSRYFCPEVPLRYVHIYSNVCYILSYLINKVSIHSEVM